MPRLPVTGDRPPPHDIPTTGYSGQVRAWIVAGGLLLIAACLAPFDFVLSSWLNPQAVPGDIRRILGLSELFAHGFGVFVALLLVWALAPGWRVYLPRLAACAVLPGLLVNLIKFSVGRYRPGPFSELTTSEYAAMGQQTWVGWFPAFQEQVAIPAGYAVQSFPSGHTATAIGLALGMAWLMPRGRWLFLSLAILACVQRVAFQAHWPSDVLVGAAIAVGICGWLTSGSSWISRKLFARWEDRPEHQKFDRPAGTRSRAA